MEYKLKHTLRPQSPAPILCVAFSPDALRVASGCSDGRLIVWSIEDGSIVWTCQGSDALLSILWIFASTDGDSKESLLCGYRDGTVVIIDVLSDSLTMSAYRVLQSPVECMAFRCDGERYRIVVGGGSEISVWAGKAQLIETVGILPPPKSTIGNAHNKIMVTSLYWLEEKVLASYLFHGIILFDVVRKSQLRIIQIPSIITSASLSSDLKHVVVNDSVNGFAMYDLHHGELVARFDCASRGWTNTSLPSEFIHDGKALLTGTTDGNVQLWDVEEGYVFSFLAHGDKAVVKSTASHYISEKDVFLITTAVSHPPDKIGVYIWQTIGAVVQSRGPKSVSVTKPENKNVGLMGRVLIVILLLVGVVFFNHYSPL